MMRKLRHCTSLQALDGSNIQAVATRHQQRCQAILQSFPRKWALWARQNLSATEWAALLRMGSIWAELESGLQLQETLDAAQDTNAPAVSLVEYASSVVATDLEIGCPPEAPTQAHAVAEGCGEPLNELEDRRLAELDEEKEAKEVCTKAQYMRRIQECDCMLCTAPWRWQCTDLS